MRRPALLFVPMLLGAASPAAAQSAFIDLSQPMTGESRFVVDADGKPVQLGPKAPVEVPKVEAPRAAVLPTRSACSDKDGNCPAEAAKATGAGATETRRAGPVIVPIRVNLPAGQAAAASAERPKTDAPKSTSRSTFRFRRR